MDQKKELLQAYLDLGKEAQEKYIQEDFVINKSISKHIIDLERDLFGAPLPNEEERLCPQCGNSYDEESNYCANCGFHIEAFFKEHYACPICQNKVHIDDNFCSSCGKDLKVEGSKEHE